MYHGFLSKYKGKRPGARYFLGAFSERSTMSWTSVETPWSRHSQRIWLYSFHNPS